MPCYPVHLETAPDGTCMAHVLDLPGCVVRALPRDEALRRLPEAIRDYHAWLRRHGEPASPYEEPIEIEVAGALTGFGPFDPGDAAALFPPDRRPVTTEEMEHYLRLMAHARADLLRGLEQFTDEDLDFRPTPAYQRTVGDIACHIVEAEDGWFHYVVRSEHPAWPEYSRDAYPT